MGDAYSVRPALRLQHLPGDRESQQRRIEVGFVALDVGEGVLDDATTSQLFAPGSQRSFCLSSEMPSLAGRRGYLTIARDAGTALGVLGLRFDAQGAFTTLFPMSAVDTVN